MIKGFEVVSLIPAKKNSNGLKNKNLKKIKGISLVEIAILASKNSNLIDKTYVSSDSKKILSLSKKNGVNSIKRIKRYCNSSTTASSVILNFLKELKKEKPLNKIIIVYLQPTSPFRNHNHLNSALKKFSKNKVKLLLSVVNVGTKFYKSLKIKEDKVIPFFKKSDVTANRQKFSDIFLPNGAIYIFYASDFMKKKYLDITNAKPFYMNNFESLDIDDKYDYNHAQKISKEYLIYKKN
jgi:CMP-N,N'-diacetyllegionaminic acid synthase